MMDCGIKDLHLDHDPALGARKRKGEGKKTVYDPPANSPDHLIYREKHDHHIKTNVRGEPRIEIVSRAVALPHSVQNHKILVEFIQNCATEIPRDLLIRIAAHARLSDARLRDYYGAAEDQAPP